ncbi:MAG: hypothetical protein M2R45_02158 [Verrucomicrobia subdivision 3 bacterium]|nr:hypothetical protein [Limisphaerales bacterium]MCS1413735.1 hypothetical protein [Limisphaerales bacterium]
MNRRDLLFAAGGAALAVVVISSFFRSPRRAVTEESGPAAVVPAQPDAPSAVAGPKLELPDPRKIAAARAQRAANRAERERLLREFPDDYYDFERIKSAFGNGFEAGGDEAYLKKVHTHYRIGDYLYSKRKDDLAFRRIMVLLLENGYGLEEWRIVTGLLASWQQEAAWHRRAFERANLFSPEEIEEQLKPIRERQEKIFRMAPTRFKFTTNITDPELIKALWEVDVGLIEPGDGSFGRERRKTVWGDKLLTDEDWLTDEFRAAQARYAGPPRERMQYHMMRAEFPKLSLPEEVKPPDFEAALEAFSDALNPAEPSE